MQCTERLGAHLRVLDLSDSCVSAHPLLAFLSSPAAQQCIGLSLRGCKLLATKGEIDWVPALAALPSLQVLDLRIPTLSLDLARQLGAACSRLTGTHLIVLLLRCLYFFFCCTLRTILFMFTSCCPLLCSPRPAGGCDSYAI